MQLLPATLGWRDTVRGCALGGRPVFVLLHGAGQSALSWAMTAVALRSRLPNCAVIAIDMRGHGHSKVVGENDMSLQNLVFDVEVGVVFGRRVPSSQSQASNKLLFCFVAVALEKAIPGVAAASSSLRWPVQSRPHQRARQSPLIYSNNACMA